MKQNFFSKLAFLGLSLLASTGVLSAQTIIWGVGSGDPVSDSIGRFKVGITDTTNTPFDALFGGTTPSSYWTSTRGGGSFPWHWSNTAVSRSQGSLNALQGRPAMPAGASFGTGFDANDGVALMDSDYYGTVNPGLYNSPANPTHDATLTSGPINMNGFADSLVSVSFNSGYVAFGAHQFHFSTDGGTTWTVYDVRAASGVTTNYYAGRITISLASQFAGATNLTDCRMRFFFSGDSWYWAIDDVRLETTDPFADLAIGGTTNGTTLGDGYSTVKFSSYYSTPLSQVSADNFHYGARIRNTGFIPVPANSGLALALNVELADGAGTFSSVYRDTASYNDAIAVGAVDSFIVKDISWVPTQLGTYRVTYTLLYADDNNATNNSFEQFFEVTEKKFSRVAPDTDGNPFANFSIIPAGTDYSEFEYGSMFFFPAGQSQNWTISSIDYRTRLRTGVVAAMGHAVVTARIYEFADPNGDGIVVGGSTATARLVALGVDSISTDPAVVPRNTVLTRTISDFVYVDAVDEEPLPLKNNQVYLVSFDQRASAAFAPTLAVNDTVGATVTTRFYLADIGATDNENYSLNFGSHANDASFAYPSPVRVRDGANEWNVIGFGADLVPSFFLNLDTIAVISNVALTETAPVSLNLFPNPVNEVLNVAVNFGAEVASAQYILTDVTGRVVSIASRRQIVEENFQMNVSNLPAGVYFFSVKAGEQVSTQRFIKR